jgi:sigma-E factor negative regulatory protein RseB
MVAADIEAARHLGRVVGMLAAWTMAWLCGGAVPGAVHAQVAAAPAAETQPLPLAEARQWLARMHEAATAGNYQGTLVFSANGVMSSSRVGHFRVAGKTFERLESLDGRHQRIYRVDDKVFTAFPLQQLVVIERRETLAGWSTTPQTVEPTALENYEMRQEGAGRVAGREAAVFTLSPRDALRYMQRLWADLSSGLMLRADVVAPGPVVLESVVFSDVAIGVKPQPETVLSGFRVADGWRALMNQQQATRLEDHGWSWARPVPGFRLAGTVLRGRTQPATQEGDGGLPPDPMLHAVFSDGLTQVSLFIETFNPKRHRTEGGGRFGATASLMQRRGDQWITVVGDVPPATLRQFADSIQRHR